MATSVLPHIGSLAGKIAIVTGSSSGLGRAISLAYAASGASVVCADLSPNAPESSPGPRIPTHELLNAQSANGKPRSIFVECDMTKAASVEATVARAVQEFGRLDIMVNNAGILAEAKAGKVFPRIQDTPESVWDADMAVNGKGVWLGCKYAISQMLRQEPWGGPTGDRGWVINMCSIVGLVGFSGTSCYSATKGAVLQMTKAVALECAKDRIHVNCINPGFTDTNMLAPLKAEHGTEKAESMLAALHPWGRMGRMEDIAKMAVFLAGDGAGWCTGGAYVVDGGYTAQ
jgi:NAD(P)-dependent dehydrogenase (short-subunit alcohol dehydrogenase family)